MNFDAASKKSTLTATFADGTTETRTTANPYTVCATVPCKGYRTGRRPFWSRSVAGAMAAAVSAQRNGFAGEIMVSTSVTVGAASKAPKAAPAVAVEVAPVTVAPVVEAPAVDVARIVAKIVKFCDGITPDAAMLAKLNAQLGGNAASLRAVESKIVHAA